MDLKVLLKIDDQIQFRDVDIVSEDERTYTIKSEGLYISYVRKDKLYQNILGHVFGFDKNKMISAWNDAIKAQIAFKKAELVRLESSIIPEGYSEDIYIIESYRKGK